MRFSQPKKQGLSNSDAMKLVAECDQISIHITRIIDEPSLSYELKGCLGPDEEGLIGKLLQFAQRPIVERYDDDASFDGPTTWN